MVKSGKSLRRSNPGIIRWCSSLHGYPCYEGMTRITTNHWPIIIHYPFETMIEKMPSSDMLIPLLCLVVWRYLLLSLMQQFYFTRISCRIIHWHLSGTQKCPPLSRHPGSSNASKRPAKGMTLMNFNTWKLT